MPKKTLSVMMAGVCSLISPPDVKASQTWIDNRYAHVYSAETNQYKIGIGHLFDNKSGLLASSVYDLGQNFQQFKSAFQEFEGWYNVDLDQHWSLQPGGLVDTTSDGNIISPYFGVNYSFNPGVLLGFRYRYNHNTKKTIDLSGVPEYDDTHHMSIFFSQQVTEKLSIQFIPELLINTNNFREANGSKHHWEIALAGRYRINANWVPYSEITWLDRDQNNDNLIRLRVGVRYYF